MSSDPGYVDASAFQMKEEQHIIGHQPAECLSKLILFGEGALLRVLTEYSRHYHHERNHQEKGNRLLFLDVHQKGHLPNRNIICRQRLGGLPKYYQRAA
jgi:hypothetical protein